MKQEHSHPALRRQVREKRTEPKAHIVPVEEFPAQAPSHAATDHSANRRSDARIQYADESVLRSVQEKCKDITSSFQHEAILYVGAEEYDYSTITILEGLQSLGFTVYTLKKPNINSWFCNEVLDSTSGLKVDFVLSNVGWGTRWSYYPRYQLKRFLRVLINSLPDAWYDVTVRLDTELNKVVPDDADERDIQVRRWSERAGSYNPDTVFSEYAKDHEMYLPGGIHRESLEAGVKSIHPNARPRLSEPRYIPGGVGGEVIIPTDIAPFISEDGHGNIHGWREWVRYRGIFNLLNKSSVAVCTAPGINQRTLWDALACGCLVMFNLTRVDIDDSSYPVTCISPFTVFQSQDELRDKLNWLTEHPTFLERLRRDSERLALEYFTPVPLAKRFLWYVREATK